MFVKPKFPVIPHRQIVENADFIREPEVLLLKPTFSMIPHRQIVHNVGLPNVQKFKEFGETLKAGTVVSGIMESNTNVFNDSPQANRRKSWYYQQFQQFA